MRDEGLVTAVGVGMNQWQAPLRIVRETDIDVVMLAGRWTLLDRSGQPLLDECAARGVAVVAAPRSTPGYWPGPGRQTGPTSTTVGPASAAGPGPDARRGLRTARGVPAGPPAPSACAARATDQ
jgi:hypothetical protein